MFKCVCLCCFCHAAVKLSGICDTSALLVLEFVLLSLRSVPWYDEWVLMEPWPFSFYKNVFIHKSCFGWGFWTLLQQNGVGQVEVEVSYSAFISVRGARGSLVLLGAGESLGTRFQLWQKVLAPCLAFSDPASCGCPRHCSPSRREVQALPGNLLTVVGVGP